MSCEKGAYVVDGRGFVAAYQRSDYPDVPPDLVVKRPRAGGWYVTVMGATMVVVAVVLLMESLIH